MKYIKNLTVFWVSWENKETRKNGVKVGHVCKWFNPTSFKLTERGERTGEYMSKWDEIEYKIWKITKS